MARKKKAEIVETEHNQLADKSKKLNKKTNGETTCKITKAKKQQGSKTKVVVSEYFSGESEVESIEKKPKFLYKKKAKSLKEKLDETNKDEISTAADDFEESTVIYRSPVRTNSSQKNERKKGKVPEEAKPSVENKLSARKRKCNDAAKIPASTAKRSKRGCQDIEEKSTREYKKKKNNSSIENKSECMKQKDERDEQCRKTSNKRKMNDLKESGKKSKQETNIQKSKEKSVRKAKITNDSKDHSSTDNKQDVDLKHKNKGGSGISAKVKSKKENVAVLPKAIDQTDVTAILLQMEGVTKGPVVSVPSTSGQGESSDVVSEFEDSDEESGDDEEQDVDKDQEPNSEDSEEEDWEEVEDHHGLSPKKSQIPDKPVEFTLDAPLMKKRKKGEFDWATYLRRKMNRFKKEIAMEMHKVHLLCLTARTLYLHSVYEDSVLKAQALSIVLVTRELTVSSIHKCTSDQLVRLFTWIRKSFSKCTAEEEEEKRNVTMRVRLRDCLENKVVSNNLEFISVCVILLRQMGFNARLMMSLQPLPFKETSSKASAKGRSTAKKHIANPAKVTKSPKSDKSKTKSETNGAKQSSSKKGSCDKRTAKQKTESSNRKGKKAKCKNPSAESEEKSELKDEIKSEPCKSGRKSGRRCSKDLPKGAYKVEEDEISELDSADEYNPKTDEDSDMEDRKKKRKNKGKGKREVRKDSVDSGVCEEDSDSDFEEDSILIRTQQLKRVASGTKNRKALSPESETSSISTKGSDSWIEVYLEKEERWICFDCVTGRMDKPYDIEQNASQPITYVLAINNDGYIKDVTQRYASAWMTSTRKLRVDSEWWEETLAPYRDPDRKRDQREDLEIQGGLQKQPLPTSIGDFKNHPLYALARHLLKFEAIYPPSSVPVGYIRGEPVYARECVYTLHSRENWLKEGRAVRIGEEAYKYVKSRPKWNKPKENPDAKDLEIYGIWQTELYIPPPAVDGKVPRNAHGNVEMFLPSMLPAGTVHLKLPALNKVAKKLDIDCAPAMVGWDHHCGFSHPLMDGWIVCEEFKDILIAAWDEEQEIIKEREAAKREKRVYENWRKLIRGMLIRERLKKTYDLESEKKVEPCEPKAEPSELNATKKKKKGIKEESETIQEKANDVQFSWPQNRLNSKVTAFKVEEL